MHIKIIILEKYQYLHVRYLLKFLPALNIEQLVRDMNLRNHKKKSIYNLRIYMLIPHHERTNCNYVITFLFF